MSSLLWKIKTTHLINCNCDFGCPCQFYGLPTHGDCRSIGVYQIHEGYYGEVRVDGLNAVAIYGWPKAIHEGNGHMQLIIDERADEAQRHALIDIMLGNGLEEGAILANQIYRLMCPNYHEPLFRAIDLDFDYKARTVRLKIDELVETAVEPIKNPVTGIAPHMLINLPSGMEFTFAEVASGTTRCSAAVPLDFENCHAHMAESEIGSSGVIRA